MNQPAWAKQLKPKPEIPDQITIISGPIRRPASQSMSRFTGAGVDGVIQPGKRTGEVDEGEGVLNANAMQALGRDEFTALSAALEQGTIQKPLLRQAIGLPPKQKFATGGIMEDIFPIAKMNQTKLNNETTKAEAAASASSQTPVQSQGISMSGNSGSKNTGSLYQPIYSPVANQTSQPEAQVQQPVSTSQSTTTPQVNSNADLAAAYTPIAKPVQPAQTPAQSVQPTLPGLNTADSNLVMNNARNRASGKAYEVYDLQQTEALGDAARQAQASAANAASKANLVNQGAGNEIRQQTSQALIENMSNNLISRAQAKEQMQQQGASDLMTIGQSIENNKQANKIDTGKRLLTMITGGNNLATILNDQSLRNQIAQDLGIDVNNDLVTQEIQTLYNSALDQNRDAFGGQAETAIQDYVNSDRTLDEALKDSNIFRKTALSMGLNPDDAANLNTVNAEISRRFNDAAMNDVDRTYKNIMESGLVDDVMQQVGQDGAPMLQTDLKQMIRDLSRKGLIDTETGTIKAGADIEWPWEDPDTRYKYVDWNGNDISGTNNNATISVSIEGNGTKYVNGNGQSVTNADMNKVWEGLSTTERENMLSNDGSPDVKKLMDKYFRTTTTADGKTVSVSTPEEFGNMMSDTAFAENIASLTEGWTSSSTFQDNNGDGAQDGEFVYYDQYGNGKIASKDELLPYIWQQLSSKYSKDGSLLTIDQFRNYWKEGKGWFVDENGVITNLDTPGKNPAAIEQASNLISNWNYGKTVLVPSEAQTLSSQWDNVSSDKKTSGEEFFLENNDTATFKGKDTINRWIMNDHVKKWAEENYGKVYKAKNGRLYEIMGTDNPTGFKTRATVIIRDVVTGETINFDNERTALPEGGYNG